MSFKLPAAALLLLIGIQAALLSVHGQEDPFGPISIATSPPSLLPGLRGARLDLTVALPREGGADLYDVSVEVMGDDPFQFYAVTVTMGRMVAGSSGTASFFFDLSASALPGVYEVGFVVRYTPAEGSATSQTRTAELKISEMPDDPFGPLAVDTVPSPLYEGSPYAKVNVGFALAVGLGQVFNVSASLVPVGDIRFVSGPVSIGTISEGSNVWASFILDVSEVTPRQYGIPFYIAYQATPWGLPLYVSRSVSIWVHAYPSDPLSLISVSTVPTVLPAGIRGARIDLQVSYPQGIGDALYNVSATLMPVSYFSLFTSFLRAFRAFPDDARLIASLQGTMD